MSSISIPLTNGKRTEIDIDDYDRVAAHKWYAAPNGTNIYAIREARVDGKQKTVRLHRFIMNAPPDKHVDHINGNGLDNRRCNLRLCTHAENMLNKRVRQDSASGFTGVYLNKQYGRWHANVRRGGVGHFVGVFDTCEEAVIARDAKIRELDGAFARLGMPDRDESPARPADRRPANSGERNNKAKLTWEAVRELRRRHAEGDVTVAQLAREHDMHPSTLWAVIEMRTWRE